MLERLFGKNKENNTPNPYNTIQNLQSNIELLEKKLTYLSSKIENEIKEAKKNASKNKPMAKMALKKKQLYENQRIRCENTIFSLQQQKISLESLSGDIEVFKVMKEATTIMSQMTQNLKLDDVDEIKDELDEQMQNCNDISTAISSPLMGSENFDEEDLERQLEELTIEESYTEEQENIKPKIIQDLPKVPNTQIQRKIETIIPKEEDKGETLRKEQNKKDQDKRQEDEDEFAQLEKEFN
jgi:charged multivesicular body protein 4A/B